MKLWQQKDIPINKEIEEFTVGDDYKYDLQLAPYDIYGNAAHVKMLNKIGIISNNELGELLIGLQKIMDLIETDSFPISIEDEDIHTKVENFLIKSYDDIGKKVHTARSRNDQILVDTRLFAKNEIFEVILLVINLAKFILIFANTYEYVPMPGYTHMQVAMPSSIGMWASSFVENLIDEMKILSAVFDLNDMNPLGSGAAYGVSIDIDRDFTTKLLDFKSTQKNSLYCGNSRGKISAHICSALSGIALILNRIATDLLLFTTTEFGFFNINESVSTGSSIMPQKKNLDIMELMRAKTQIILGYESQIKHMISNIPSGYNRDYQDSKPILMNSFSLIKKMIRVTEIVFDNITPNEKNLNKSHIPGMYAADEAYKLVKNEKMPFRDAYHQVKNQLDSLTIGDPIKNIKEKKHIGATGNLQLKLYQKELLLLSNQWENKYSKWKNKLHELLYE